VVVLLELSFGGDKNSGARVLKAFNALPVVILEADPALLGGGRAPFVSGGDTSARIAVVDLAGSLGFAVVDRGDNRERRYERYRKDRFRKFVRSGCFTAAQNNRNVRGIKA
jgi:hypothetical protein